MKISYRTHPVLKLLKSGDFSSVMFFEGDGEYLSKKMQEIKGSFGITHNSFLQNIKLISKPFAEAINLSCDKMISQEMRKDILSRKSEGVLLYDNMTYCYFISPLGKGDFVLTYFRFAKHQDGYVVLTGYVSMSKIDGVDGLSHYISSEMDSSGLGYQDMAFEYLVELTAILNFIKYAEVETKHLKPKSRTKDIDCKYINDTDLNITTLDSKWFTTLVKSDAFKVRGHFRLQACGEGMKERKLIWINDFQKEGYTAPARKINN